MEAGNGSCQSIGAGKSCRPTAIVRISGCTTGDIFIACYGALFNIFGYLLQLIFRSGTSMLDFGAVPILIFQTSNVVALTRVGAYRSIRIVSALLANDDAARITA